MVQRFTATSNKAEALPGPLRLIVASARPSDDAATSADQVDGKSRRRRGKASDSVSSTIMFLIPRNMLVQETPPVNAHPAASQCADLMGRRASNSGPIASCVAKKPTPVSTDPAYARANTEPRPWRWVATARSTQSDARCRPVNGGDRTPPSPGNIDPTSPWGLPGRPFRAENVPTAPLASPPPIFELVKRKDIE